MRIPCATIGLVCIGLALACSSKSSVKGGSGGGGNAGAAGGGGVGGTCTPKVPATGTGQWPDSIRQYCTNGAAVIQCNTASGADALQDGAVEGKKPSYKAIESNVVEDTVTGLQWRTDYGSAKRTAAVDHCTGLTGGWRLPSYLELSSLVDYGAIDPAIDEATFETPPTTPLAPLRIFWTSSESADGKRNWAIDFTGGLPFSFADLPVHSVRCVRGSLAGEIIRSNCSTVSDSRTGLMWAQSVPNQGYVWGDALEYCDGLGHAGLGGWRLPNLKELQTIIETNVAPPLVDTTLFIDAPVDTYWTSTASQLNVNEAGAIDFETGAVPGPARSEAKRVRCVRDF